MNLLFAVCPAKRDQSAAGVRLRNLRRVATPVGVFTPNTSTDLNAEGETPLAVRRGVLKLVLTDGLEPPTLCSSGRRSTNCATSARKWRRIFTLALGVFGRVRCSSGTGWIHSSTNPPNQIQSGGLTGNRTPNNGVTSQHYSRLTMSPRWLPRVDSNHQPVD